MPFSFRGPVGDLFTHCFVDRQRAAWPKSTISLLAVLVLAAPAWAEQAPASEVALEGVVVTATRTPLQPSDVIADVIVVTREQIERRGAGDLSDLLRSTGAVELARTGGPGQTTSLFIHGAETRHTLVLIDGIRIDAQATGGAPWESIPLGDIDHIEILRGPASAIYGSDAIGGVVQIFTRKGTGPTALSIGLSSGSLNTRGLDGSVLGSSGRFDYAVSAATERSSGLVLVPNTSDPNYNPASAGYEKHNYSTRLGAQLDPADRLDLIALTSHLDGRFNDYSLSALGQDIEDTSAGKLSWSRQWTPDLITHLGFGESIERYEDVTDVYLSETRIRSYSLDGSYRVAPGQQVLFVAERKADDLTDSTLTAKGTGSSSRSENGLGIGYLAILGKYDVQGNVRRDQDSEFGSANTGSLGLGYQVAPGFKIVGAVGSAFRAPTIFQNSSVYGPLSRAHGQSLSAETGHNTELALRYAGNGAEASVTAYRNLVDNLINFGAAGPCLSPYGCYGNVAHAQLEGLSFRAQTDIDHWRLAATWDVQDPKDLGTGNLLPRRARQFGTVHAQTQWRGWDLGSGVAFAGRRFDDTANTEPLGGYALLNLDAGYRLSSELRLQANVDNLTNHAYQTALGYAQLPRTLLVSLRYSPAP